MDHDLLTEPLLAWRDRSRSKGKTTLPGVLAKLASGELADFPRLRAHQLHPWCMFLTQLAAIALRRADLCDPRASEEDWRRMLLALTGGAHEPWALVVGDLSEPAFFQPPVPEGTLDRWKASEHPDDIDILVTAKAHDVKTSLIASDDLEAWAYALVTLQTMQGIYGVGNYGVCRMHKGYGSRPKVSFVPGESTAATFRRDVRVLLGSWDELLDSGYREAGIALVWTHPWDGQEPLGREDLSPHFIEVCRRVRLVKHDGGAVCRRTGSSGGRCLRGQETGDVGDPWIPVKRASGTALNVTGHGFRYELVAQILSGSEYARPAALWFFPDEGDGMLFSAWALARGQGATDGLHERSFPINRLARTMFGTEVGRSEIGRRASAMVAKAVQMKSSVLRPAMKRLLEGGRKGRKLSDNEQSLVVVALSCADRAIDERFFDHLLSTLSQAQEDAILAFDQRLHAIARAEFSQATERWVVPDAQRLRAICEAEALFDGCLRRHFPDLVGAGRDNVGDQS